MSPIFPLVLLFVSVAGILILLGRRFPEVTISHKPKPIEVPGGFAEPRRRPQFLRVIAALARAVPRIRSSRVKESARPLLEKFLRKLRLTLMKAENSLSRTLERFSSRRDTEGGADEAERPKILGNVYAQRSAQALLRSSRASEGQAADALGSEEAFWLGVVRSKPKDPYAYKKLGEVYCAKQHWHEARSVLKYAAKLDPADSEVAERLAELWGKKTRRE